MACVAHQKSIIDDVLTLSKLGSGLLVVSPVEIQPLSELRRGLRLFEGELRQADIDLKVVVDRSYEELQIDWVLLDPTRLVQILMNLLTNAIKCKILMHYSTASQFTDRDSMTEVTKDEATRQITVTISASQQRPESNDGVAFLPTTQDNNAQLEIDGESTTSFIRITVEDTGRGIEHHDLHHLFQRFQQGSPRTHVKYGGSGLGLFICRELAKMQGGQIGVSSAFGKGSTFAFYVRAKRCEVPLGGDTRGEKRRKLSGTTMIASDDDKRRKTVLLVEDNLGESLRSELHLWRPLTSYLSFSSESESHGKTTPLRGLRCCSREPWPRSSRPCSNNAFLQTWRHETRCCVDGY